MANLNQKNNRVSAILPCMAAATSSFIRPMFVLRYLVKPEIIVPLAAVQLLLASVQLSVLGKESAVDFAQVSGILVRVDLPDLHDPVYCDLPRDGDGGGGLGLSLRFLKSGGSGGKSSFHDAQAVAESRIRGGFMGKIILEDGNAIRIQIDGLVLLSCLVAVRLVLLPQNDTEGHAGQKQENGEQV
ncbi:MAG TPA: hypothetical protein VN765_04765 [Candidatus Acidoferrum sp.]|nr:hypothetical protein [Candidatus Acidoferrum sp.]